MNAAADVSPIALTNQPLSRQKTQTTKPRIGTIKKFEMGDLMCYVDLVDPRGKSHHLGADFDLCNQDKKFLNKKVRLSYQTAKINDCQSAEPCGKTKMQTIISKMELMK